MCGVASSDGGRPSKDQADDVALLNYILLHVMEYSVIFFQIYKSCFYKAYHDVTERIAGWT